MIVVPWLLLVALIIMHVAFRALAAGRRRRRMAEGPAQLGEHLKRARAKQERAASGLRQGHHGWPGAPNPPRSQAIAG